MKDVFVEIPFAKVEFATETGGLTIQQKQQIKSSTMDFDIMSIETKRDIGIEDAPTFVITLIYREEWYKQVGSNDFVQISLGRGKRSGPVFYGMVDTIQKTWSFPELKPVRTITISGRGFNKAVVQFGIGAVQEVNFSFQAAGFFEGQDQGFSETTPAQLIRTTLDFYMSKGIDINFANGKSWKDYVNTIYLENADEEDMTLGNVMGYYNYQGGLWEYLKELRNAPFYEMFWEIVGGKLHFIVRPTPFNPDDWKALPLRQVDERDIIDESTGRSDLETYTVYSVKGESMTAGLDQLFGFPIWYKPFYKVYGLRRLEVQSKYIRGSQAPIAENLVYDQSGGSVAGQSGPGPGGKLGYPVAAGTRISSRFGRRNQVTANDTGNHLGIDFAGASGAPIYAAAAGTVTKVTRDRWRGHYIDVDHGGGITTRYQHCRVRPSPPVGSTVTKGQVIAQIGSTGDSTGPHLHFEVHVNGKAVDPWPYISGSSSSGGGGGGGSRSSGGGGRGTNPPFNPATPIRKVDWAVHKGEKGSNSKEHDKRLEELKKEINRIGSTQITEREQEMFNGASPQAIQAALQIAASLTGMGGFKTAADVIQGILNDDPEIRDLMAGTQEALAGSTEATVSKKTIDLFNWNIKNNYMENGSITVKGDYEYQVGTRLYMQTSDMEYYIENVAHSFIYNEAWTTTLQVTRGLPYGTRFNAPWNEWETITPEDLETITGISQATMNTAAPGTAPSGEVSGGSSSGGGGGTTVTSGSITNMPPGTLKSIVEAAYSKLGNRYVWGHTGPNSFDCSGLMYWAYKQQGITLPRNSAAQGSSAGRPVNRSELKPGDLMFFATGGGKRISHVGMYIGDGKLLHASSPSTGVRIDDINSKYYTKTYVSARRIIE